MNHELRITCPARSHPAAWNASRSVASASRAAGLLNLDTGRDLGDSRSFCARLADLDGDEDLDVIIGYRDGRGGTRVYFHCSDLVEAPPGPLLEAWQPRR